jgi:RES domain-containing protein
MRELPDDYVANSVEIPNELVIITLSAAELPPNWWSNPHPVETRNLGSAWVSSLASAVLCVPSAVIRSEKNYILNPAHPAFCRISFGEPESFIWDERLQMFGAPHNQISG